MSEIYTLPQLKRVLTPVFDAYGVRKAILFGSYAKGHRHGKKAILTFWWTAGFAAFALWAFWTMCSGPWARAWICSM